MAWSMENTMAVLTMTTPALFQGTFTDANQNLAAVKGCHKGIFFLFLFEF
jgi:hypothetical protein